MQRKDYTLEHLARAVSSTALAADKLWEEQQDGPYPPSMTTCINTCCDELPEELKTLVSILLIIGWNDALEWAGRGK